MNNFLTPQGPIMDPVLYDLKNEDIDKILRRELSAVKSYKQVLENLKVDSNFVKLLKFRDEHIDAVDFWNLQARKEGKRPNKTSGIWGAITETYIGTSKLFGNPAALKALRNGEEQSLKVYQEMLESDLLTNVQRNEIKKTFIPLQNKHIEEIAKVEVAEIVELEKAKY